MKPNSLVHAASLFVEHEPVAPDPEEIFAVLSGTAKVEFVNATAPLTLKPGDVVCLAAGAKTVWTVTETLRRVYLAGSL